VQVVGIAVVEGHRHRRLVQPNPVLIEADAPAGAPQVMHVRSKIVRGYGNSMGIGRQLRHTVIGQDNDWRIKQIQCAVFQLPESAVGWGDGVLDRGQHDQALRATTVTIS